MGKVRIKEVAAAAGVSTTSISNYLNSRFDNMSPATRERIRAVVEDLGYRPSTAALQLKTGRTPMLGLLVPTVANAFFGELAVAMEQAAREQDFSIVLCNTLQSAATERRVWEDLVSLGVRGVICSSAVVTTNDLEIYSSAGVSVVAVDEKRSDTLPQSVDFVSIDHTAAVVMAVDHLVSLGHRSLCYIGDRGRTTYSRRRKAEGFLAAAARHGLPDPRIVMPEPRGAVLEFDGNDLADLGRRAVPEILAATPWPTAVITFNDMTALGALEALKERGIAVPEQVSVMGIDGIGIGAMLTPPLSSVRQPLEESAAAAVGCIAERFQGRTRRRDVMIAPQLLVRGSTGPAPRRSAEHGPSLA